MKRIMIGTVLAALAACSAPDESTPATDAARSGPPAATATATEAAYDGPIPMPIMVGGSGAETDACGAAAQVANLDPGSANYASVRDAPSNATKERDRLDAGQQVAICSEANGWNGVVYAKTGDEAQDCGIGDPATSEGPYLGPCRQGWVESRYLEVTAG